MFLKSSAFPLVMLCLVCFFNLSAQEIDCSNAQSIVTNKTFSAKNNLAGLDSILNNLEVPNVPISVLFKTDISDQKAVDEKIVNLSKLLNTENIGNSDEFKIIKECSPESKEFKILLELRKSVNSKKIKFFSLPRNKRIEVASNYEKLRKSKKETEKLSAEIEKVTSAIVESEQSDEISTADVFQDENQSALIMLSSTVSKNEKKYLEFLDFLKDRKEALRLISLNFNKHNDIEDINSQLVIVKKSWRGLVDELRGLFPRLNSFSLSNLPINSQNVLATKEVKNASLVAIKRHDEIVSNIASMIDSLKNESFILLRDIGTKRAILISECDSQGLLCNRSRGFNEENLGDINRELRVIPLKLEAGFIAKKFEIERKYKSGLDGWIDLIYQLFILFGVLLSPIVLARCFDWLTNWLDTIRKNLLSKSVLDYRMRTNYAVILSRIIPFVSPSGLLVLTFLVERLILTTDLAEMALFVFLLQVYYGYKLSSLLVKMVLQTLFSSEAEEDVKTNRTRINNSAKNIARLVFVEIAILHLVEDTARHALVYNLMSTFIFWVNVTFVLLQCRDWRNEINRSFSFRYPKLNTKIPERISGFFQLFLLPVLLVLCLLFDLYQILIAWLSKFDITKTILAEVFKKKLQSSETFNENAKPPGKNYLKYFDYYLPAEKKIFVDRENSIVDGVRKKITAWHNGLSSDDLVFIIGNRGMGKTTTLEKIYSGYSENYSTVLGSVPAKTINAKDFYVWLSSLIGQQVHSLHDFEEFDSSLKKKQVYFVDDLQNFFISKINGFTAYEILIELVGLKTKNIFWVFTVNSRSWTYLKGVYGSEHFYGTNYLLHPWKDIEIQKLIVLRHQLTGFSREYDKSIKAYGTSDSVGQKAEAQFFRLLWGQSRGNPRSALMYWVSAISEIEEKSIHVGVPQFVDSGPVGRMSDEGHFLLASLARHESLTYSELIEVTGVAPETVRKCLKEFDDQNLTWTNSQGRVRISSKSQYVVDYFLLGKNFLYE